MPIAQSQTPKNDAIARDFLANELKPSSPLESVILSDHFFFDRTLMALRRCWRKTRGQRTVHGGRRDASEFRLHLPSRPQLSYFSARAASLSCGLIPDRPQSRNRAALVGGSGSCKLPSLRVRSRNLDPFRGDQPNGLTHTGVELVDVKASLIHLTIIGS